MKYTFLILSALWLLLLPACHKEKEAEPAVPVLSLQDSATNAHLEAVAIAWAKFIDDAEVRSFMYDEIGKRYDGDYAMLYKNISSFAFRDGATLKDRMLKLPHGKSTIHALMNGMIKVQIAMPVHYDSWKHADFTPLVGFTPMGLQEKYIKEIKAFDKHGNVHYLNTAKSPDVPVVIIGFSERVNEKGELLEPYAKLAEELRSGRVEDASPGKRKAGTQEFIRGLTILDMEALELWPWSEAELRLEVLKRVNKRPETEKFIFPRVKGKLEGDYPIFEWRKGQSDDFVFIWTEIDADDPSTVKVGFEGFEYSVERGKGDDEAGQRTLYRDTPYGAVYETGVLRWTEVYK